MTVPPRRACYLAAAAAALIAGAAAWWQTRPDKIDAIVVRPFGGAAPLAGALRDEILDDLARVPGLRVLPEAAAPLAHTGLLEASVERSSDRITVVAQLTRFDGHRYWTRKFDRPLPDLNAIPLEIAASISSRARRKDARHKPPLAAYDAYLAGRSDFDRPQDGGLARAIECFDRATGLDPDFAEAWAWLSIANEYLADSGAVRPNLALPAARDAADRAAALDPGSAAAHLALGMIDLQYDWDWTAARQELDRALQLSPGSPMAAYWRERWNQATGRAAPPDFHLANLPPVHNEAEARQLLDDADDIRVETYLSAAALALVANGIHDTDGTFQWLETAYEERCVQLPYILWNPALPRSDPRFAGLLRRMNLETTDKTNDKTEAE